MSDEGEKTCPLCAEEMDLTDQQLKPCKCGYEICVWCWHHIMDMAEKDDTEGRCPACRTPYNKEKIVGTAANCERLVAEISMEKKKSQRGKSKPSEGRKQLSSVRVIQRNLVYVVGLPLNLADEELLQRKEYFGQYGKVLKVSISRTAAGAIQHFANNTCSVYITYAKEDEAIRCIQSVHAFVLDGRPLRACFGTTKYCHAWLRNVPCSNPDCLYLHEIGSQEDSFTKDEVISAYTRVQQVTGAAANMQRRSGASLPPPSDDYCNNASASLGKPFSKVASNNSASAARVSPPNSSSGRSVALPAGASWGTRSSNNLLSPASLTCSSDAQKQKPDSCSVAVSFSSAVAGLNQGSLVHPDVQKKEVSYVGDGGARESSKLETGEHLKQNFGRDHQESPANPILQFSASNRQLYSELAAKDKNKSSSLPSNITKSLESNSCGPDAVEDRNNGSEENLQNLCSDMLSMSVNSQSVGEQGYAQEFKRPIVHSRGGSTTSSEEICSSDEHSDLRLDTQTRLVQLCSELEKDLLSFDEQRIKDPEIVSGRSYSPSVAPHLSSNPRSHPSQRSNTTVSVSVNRDIQVVDNNLDSGSVLQRSNRPFSSSGYNEHGVNMFPGLNANAAHPYLFGREEKNEGIRGLEAEIGRVSRGAPVDAGESSIISNILSLDFDPWDESLTSPQNLAKLLGDNERDQNSLGGSSSRKVQQSNQSRFSFAREEESMKQIPGRGLSLSNFEQGFNGTFNEDYNNSRISRHDEFGSRTGFSLFNYEETDNHASGLLHLSSNKLSASRSQVSAPPGFTSTNRTPPPGFASSERTHQSFDALAGNHMLDPASLLRSQYQAPSAGNMFSNGDIEFMDPAILAVGKGRLPSGVNSSGLDMTSNFPPQLSTFGSDARFQLLMQRSVSSHQNQRFTDTGNGFTQLGDAYGIPGRMVDQTVANNLSPFTQINIPQARNTFPSNAHWDGWNEVQGGNDVGMGEILRGERVGFNKLYSGYEDSKFRMTSSNDLYNRSFGI